MEELTPINSEIQLEKLFKQNYFEAGRDAHFGVKNLLVTVPLTLPIKKKLIESILLKNQHFSFLNCKFEAPIFLKTSESNIQFNNCKFQFIDAEDQNLRGKMRFRECRFFDFVRFNNATFYDLADFWRSTFYKPIIFFKTEFLGTTVFSATTFRENVLFTYCLIDKLILFRGTKIEKGFDISTAIRSGDMSIFDFHVKDYVSLNENLSEEAYESAISLEANIPIKNKRETFRILKQEHVSQNNVVQSIEYKKLEKETLRNELLIRLAKNNKSRFEKTVDHLEIKLDQLNLWLNKVSNNHGSSYGRAFLFVALVGWLFFYFSLISTTKYGFSINPYDWEFSKGLKYYVQFLLPTHRFDYMGDVSTLTTCFYVFDFFGRMFVGYGIYQFIQAFRKFR